VKNLRLKFEVIRYYKVRKQAKLGLNSIKRNNVFSNKIKPLHVSARIRRTEHHTQYRRPSVKEQDHHWDSQQGFN
jgi:hypothetical protein